MRVKQKLMYMTLGGVLVLAGYILASFANDSVAQSGVQDVTFGKITCSSLDVVDKEGKRGVSLYIGKYGAVGEYGGVVRAFANEGLLSGVALFNTEYGGRVVAHGKWEDYGEVALRNDENGGFVVAFGKDGGKALLSNNRHGGEMVIFNKDSKNVLQASVADTGGGLIRTRDKHGNRTGQLP